MAESENLRKRLDALDRGPLPPRKASPGDSEEIRRAVRKLRERESRSGPILYPRDLPRTPAPVPPAPASRHEPVLLEHAIEGIERHVPRRGRAYVVEVHQGEGRDELSGTFRHALELADSGLRHRLRRLWPPEGLEAADFVFLDLETTGLTSTPLFLIGTMEWEEDGFVVRQYFARDYSEEAASIALAAASIATKKLLVTFNGKSFDVPYLRMRAAANAVPLQEGPSHFDLIHVCRRIWRRAVPDCRLQTLETCICGRTRCGDIPGAEIPAAYHEYVRTGDASVIVEILRHNMRDLVTMADLMSRFPPPNRPGTR